MRARPSFDPETNYRDGINAFVLGGWERPIFEHGGPVDLSINLVTEADYSVACGPALGMQFFRVRKKL